jgi:CDP-diacylglycerol--glycerol-3-phosphate 3-phosphatidyltransferase
MGTAEKLRADANRHLQRAMTPLVSALARLRISPTQVTVTGFVLALASAGLLVAGSPTSAGLLFLVACSFDLVDGALARVRNQTTPFGAFLDSTLDRVGEGTMLVAIGYCLATQTNAVAVAAAVAALLGGMLTSYTRARAEALGVRCDIGWVSRAERVMLITIGLLFDILPVMVFVLALLTLWTAAQRVLHVYRALGVNA